MGETHYNRYEDDKDRIMLRVLQNSDGCWEWQASKVTGGYGRVGFRNTLWLAHRLAYHLFIGEIPEGMMVLHSCDNPCCCNPEHLFIGTQQDNMRDMQNKGRHPKKKLASSDVRFIRELAREGYTFTWIAGKFDVSRRLVGMIVDGTRRTSQEDADD